MILGTIFIGAIIAFVFFSKVVGKGWVGLFSLVVFGFFVLVVFQSPAPMSSQAIARVCNLTEYSTLCLNSLINFPGALRAEEHDFFHITLNITLHRMSAALNSITTITGINMDKFSGLAYDQCIMCLELSVDDLSESLIVVTHAEPPDTKPELRFASHHDVHVWGSAVLANLDMCREGLQQAKNHLLEERINEHLKDLNELTIIFLSSLIKITLKT